MAPKSRKSNSSLFGAPDETSGEPSETPTFGKKSANTQEKPSLSTNQHIQAVQEQLVRNDKNTDEGNTSTQFSGKPFTSTKPRVITKPMFDTGEPLGSSDKENQSNNEKDNQQEEDIEENPRKRRRIEQRLNSLEEEIHYIKSYAHAMSSKVAGIKSEL